MGVLPGWWLGAADGRVTEPYVDSQRWDAELRAAGFTGAEVVAYDGYLNNNIIATPALPQPTPAKRVTLLHPVGGVVDKVRGHLERAGYKIDLRTLDVVAAAADAADDGDHLSLPPHQDVLSVLDLDPAGPFFHQLTQTQFAHFQELVRQARDRHCGVLWLTGASQVGCADPRFAPVIGVARVVRTETGIDFATLELDNLGGDLGVVPAVLAEFHRRVAEEDVTPEAEWACVRGKVLIGRYHFVDVPGGITEKRKPGEEEEDARTVLKLEQHRPGLVNTLFWERRAEAAALGEHEVRVDVRTVGLNFKDVLVSLGVIAEQYSIGRGMGYECSGVVTAVGSGVRDYLAGDRVLACSSGAFTTSLRVSETLCAKMPEGMTFEEGATLPVVYCTAIYGLLDAGRLSKGMVSEPPLPSLRLSS